MTTYTGTTDDNTLIGSNSADALVGNLGNDTLFGGARTAIRTPAGVTAVDSLTIGEAGYHRLPADLRAMLAERTLTIAPATRVAA